MHPPLWATTIPHHVRPPDSENHPPPPPPGAKRKQKIPHPHLLRLLHGPPHAGSRPPRDPRRRFRLQRHPRPRHHPPHLPRLPHRHHHRRPPRRPAHVPHRRHALRLLSSQHRASPAQHLPHDQDHQLRRREIRSHRRARSPRPRPLRRRRCSHCTSGPAPPVRQRSGRLSLSRKNSA